MSLQRRPPVLSTDRLAQPPLTTTPTGSQQGASTLPFWARLFWWAGKTDQGHTILGGILSILNCLASDRFGDQWDLRAGPVCHAQISSSKKMSRSSACHPESGNRAPPRGVVIRILASQSTACTAASMMAIFSVAPKPAP